MSSGDTLVIGDGTYAEQLMNVVPAGRAGAPTIIRAQNRNQAILLPTTTSAGWAVINVNASYTTFDGLVVDARNCYENGGFYITNNGSTTTTNVTIKNGTIRNATGGYSSPSAAPNGIAMNGGVTNHVFQNNDIYDIKGHGIYNKGSANLIEGNRIYSWSQQSDISAYGIQVYCYGCTASNNIVRNNSIHDYQYGIILSSGSNNTAYNNLVYNNAIDGIRIRYNCTNCTVYSNTIFSNKSSCAFFDSSSTGGRFQNNICRSNGTNTVQDDSHVTVIDHNLIGTDPLFVNAAAGDLHLTSASPARNSGIAISSVTTDLDGNVRPQGSWDIGAFIYASSVQLAAPGNLRVAPNQ
jgi:parallel beta-helix repeat protein